MAFSQTTSPVLSVERDHDCVPRPTDLVAIQRDTPVGRVQGGQVFGQLALVRTVFSPVMASSAITWACGVSTYMTPLLTIGGDWCPQ